MNPHPHPPAVGEASQAAVERVVHELRNPLNGIMGGVELLKDTALSAEQRRYVELIASGSDALLELIGRLPQALGQAESGGSRVLVAEESRINQMISVELLGRLGLEAEAVGTAAALREALCTGRFHTILVDCRMPDIDPCLLAQEIRQMEGAARRVRIVGVAPDDRPGERERYLGAGMDAYLAKPLRLERLRQIFLAQEQTATAPPAVGDAVDFDQIGVLRAESPGLLERLALLFEESAEKAIAEMRAAAERDDRRAIAAAAHMLKGSASNFGAHRMMAACQALEEGTSPTLRGAPLQKLLDALSAEYQFVIKALQEYSRPSGAR